MSDIAVRVQGLSKQFRRGVRPAKYYTLRDAVTQLVRKPFQSSHRRIQNDSADSSTFYALRDVSFEVMRGEVVGVLGRNGAGKSTLLKILSRISDPSSGFAEMYGRTGALLEVGTGFHPELTGRENVYLNGAILGMTKAEINKNFDAIVSFAEVEEFIDTPVKHYSSGMYLRLAFSVAAQLEPEILLMDEVLAVGDAAFQKKCLGKMGAVAQDGRTVLFVSHNMAALRDLCSRAIWLEHGEVCGDGDVDEVVKSYLTATAQSDFQFVSSDFQFTIDQVIVKNGFGQCTRQFTPGDDLTIEISFEAKVPIRRPYLQILIESANGKCFTANMLLDGCRPEILSGRGTIACTFKAVPLLPQSYTVKLNIRAADGREHILRLQDVASFDIDGQLDELGLFGDFRGLAYHSTPVMIPYEWVHPDGTVLPMALGRGKTRFDRGIPELILD